MIKPNERVPSGFIGLDKSVGGFPQGIVHLRCKTGQVTHSLARTLLKTLELMTYAPSWEDPGAIVFTSRSDRILQFATGHNIVMYIGYDLPPYVQALQTWEINWGPREQESGLMQVTVRGELKPLVFYVVRFLNEKHPETPEWVDWVNFVPPVTPTTKSGPVLRMEELK